MSLLRPFEASDIFRFNHVNLDAYTVIELSPNRNPKRDTEAASPLSRFHLGGFRLGDKRKRIRLDIIYNICVLGQT